MTLVKVIEKTGKVLGGTYKYEIYQLGNMSYRIKCNGKTIDKILDSESDCVDFINRFPEF